MKRSASSLLMVVLIMSAVSVMMITASQVLLVTSRQGITYDTTETAREMARSGVEEALYRASTAGQISPWGEYGNLAGDLTTTDYSLGSERRYLSGSLCTSPASFAPSSTGDCPSYDLAIRDTMAVGVGSDDATSFNQQAFQPQDFPSGVTKVIPLLSGGQIVLVANSALTSYTYSLCNDYAGTSGCVAQSATPTAVLSNVGGAGAKSMKVTFNYSGTPTPSLMTLQGCSPATGMNHCVLGKGYTTADIIGYAGANSQVRMVMEWHGGLNTTPVIRETAQYYSTQGIRLPSVN